MKMTEKVIDSGATGMSEARSDPAKVPLLAPRDARSLIHRTTDRQLQDVSKKLARINQQAIRAEADGDYFQSGELAYQIQEIIRATGELFKKSQRAKG